MPLRRILWGGAVIGALSIAAADAHAACKMTTDTLAFGSVRPDDRADSVGTVRVTCTETTGFQIRPAGGGAGRKLRGAGSSDLRYDLYIDPNRSLAFGDGSGGSFVLVGFAGPGAPFERSLYGRIRSDQRVPRGAYTDSLVLSLIPQ
ncbi:Csu type fimbrial protein [Marinivivus vitaminiproducens]|uniref:Csu type fimbrial protein n=1 Tax=Marinivivus vitaminiproducens TaxID=3035935 RepID=UPI0027A73952|nr:spore coat U domain-containing protein [Geminicoccaceae bacterium SCSIO 64248]